MTKQVTCLGVYQKKEQLLTRLKSMQKKLEITSIEPNTDPMYIAIQKRDIALVQTEIDNFDINAKIITAKSDQAAIDFILSEGYDEDGNHYKTLDEYKKPRTISKKDNTPWQKGDDLAI